MAEVLQWDGTERRAGDDRRVRVEQWATDRRQAERRRGGIGTHHPDPTMRLLEGIHIPESLAFEPSAGTTGDTTMAGGSTPTATGPLSHVPAASDLRAAASGFAPAHEAHDAIPSTAALGGHPVHPMVVPLPIGSFTGALAADLAYAASGDPFFARAGRLLTAAGLVTGALAAVLGGIDFWSKGQVRSHRAAWLHAGGNAAALGLAGLSLGLRSRDEEHAARRGGLALSLLSGLVLVVTGWLGGELSYRHRVGITEREEKAS